MKRLLLIIALTMLLTGCAGDAYQRTRQSVVGIQTGIVAAGPVLDALETEGAFADNPDLPSELRDKGRIALLSLNTALQTAEQLNSVDEGRQTLLMAISASLDGMGQVLDALPESEALARFRLTLTGIRTALLVAQTLALGG